MDECMGVLVGGEEGVGNSTALGAGSGHRICSLKLELGVIRRGREGKKGVNELRKL
jgi:hypothetical protein